MPITKVALNCPFASEAVALVPLLATRGAATNSQSSSRCRAASRAAACWALPALVMSLWQKAPYRSPCDGRQVWPGAGVMSRPTASGLPWASYGSEPSLCPVQALGEQLPQAVSIRARFCCATQSAAGNPSTRPAYSHQPLPGAQESPKPTMASPFLQPVSKLVGPTKL